MNSCGPGWPGEWSNHIYLKAAVVHPIHPDTPFQPISWGREIKKQTCTLGERRFRNFNSWMCQGRNRVTGWTGWTFKHLAWTKGYLSRTGWTFKGLGDMPRLTEFGKAVRIARINKDMKLLDMSLFIGYSPQFVGAVEYGKKKIPNDYVALIVNKCSFLPDDVRNICNAYGKELNNDKT